MLLSIAAGTTLYWGPASLASSRSVGNPSVVGTRLRKSGVSREKTFSPGWFGSRERCLPCFPRFSPADARSHASEWHCIPALPAVWRPGLLRIGAAHQRGPGGRQHTCAPGRMEDKIAQRQDRM